MQESIPMIQIFMPTYNKGRYIENTVKSILRQTYSNFTLTIVDNASTDETESIINKIKDTRIRYIKNDRNIGAIKNINKCISMATEKYIAIYHSDDIYEDTILQEEIEVLKNNNKVGAVFTDKKKIDKYDNIIDESRNRFNEIFGYEELLKEVATNNTPLVCPTFMCRSEVFKKVGTLNEKYLYAGDTEFYLRIAKVYKLYLINKQLIRYRVYLGQESSIYLFSTNMQEEYLLLEEEIKYYEKQFKKVLDDEFLNKYNKKLSHEYLRIANSYVLTGNYNDLKIKESIKNNYDLSLKLYKFKIRDKFGVFQKLHKYKMYFIIKLIYKAFGKH